MGMLAAGGVLISLSALPAPAVEKSIGPFSGHIDNQTRIASSDVSIEMTWQCKTIQYEPQSCGKVTQVSKVDANGAFYIPRFSVPVPGGFKRASIFAKLITPKGEFFIADDSKSSSSSSSNSSIQEKLSHIVFNQVDSVTIYPELIGGGDINTWLKTTAPHHELTVESRQSGGNSNNVESYRFDTIQSFPYSTGDRFFVFTSQESFRAGVQISYVFSSSSYATGGAEETKLIEFSYSGLPKADAIQSLMQMKVDPSLVNTNISGQWSGSLLVNSEYGVRRKMPFSHADLSAKLTCENGKLAGTLVVLYQDSYDLPSFSKEIVVSGECGNATASTRISLPLKEYLGQRFFQKDVAIVFDRSIGTHATYATVTDLETREVLGDIRLKR
jgi:hypothetical protein